MRVKGRLEIRKRHHNKHLDLTIPAFEAASRQFTPEVATFQGNMLISSMKLACRHPFFLGRSFLFQQGNERTHPGWMIGPRSR